jgi:hypothetical protein
MIKVGIRRYFVIPLLLIVDLTIMMIVNIIVNTIKNFHCGVA